MGIWDIIGALIGVCAILALAYYCSRMLGKTWIKTSASRELKVIDQLHVGQDKQILLVKLREKNYLIGVSQTGISLLAEPEGEFEERELPSMGPSPADFKEVLKKYASNTRRHKGGKDE